MMLLPADAAGSLNLCVDELDRRRKKHSKQIRCAWILRLLVVVVFVVVISLELQADQLTVMMMLLLSSQYLLLLKEYEHERLHMAYASIFLLRQQVQRA